MAEFGLTFAPTKVINEAVIENPHGAQVAFNASGSCIHHPDILLRKKTALGGWKVLQEQCPRCATEWEDRRAASMGHLGGGGSNHSMHSNNSSSSMGHIHQRPSPFVPPSPPQQQRHAPPAVYQPYQQQHQQQQHQPSYPNMHPPQPQYAPTPPSPPRPPYATASPLPPPQPTGVTPSGVAFAKVVAVRHNPHAPSSSAMPPAPHSPTPPPRHVPPPQQQPNPMPSRVEGSLRLSDSNVSNTFSSMSSSLSASLPNVGNSLQEKEAKQKLNDCYKNDDVRGLLTTMRSFPGCSSLLGVGSKALWRLGFRYGKAVEVLNHGGKDIIKNAVEQHSRLDEDIAGYGPMLLKMLEQMVSPSSQLSVRPSSHAPPPLSSLATVDSRVEKIAVDDINYLSSHNAMDKLLALMRWYPRSATIAGAGVKALFTLVNQQPEGAVSLERIDQQTIKDAVHYFSAINDDVADYGSMVLGMCKTAPTTSSRSSRPPLSSLPQVDPLVERMALQDLDDENDASRIIVAMRRYTASAKVQGACCKLLWTVCQSGNVSQIEFMCRSDSKDAIKDAVYYFGNDRGDVADYGTMLLDRLVEYCS